MATLNPTPNLGVQPESPIAAPRTVDMAGAISGLANTFIDTRAPAKASQASLDDAALRPFSERVFAIINESDLDPSAQRRAVTALQREFVRTNPRLTDKAKTLVNDGFGMTDPVAEVRPEDAQTARINEFMGTPIWAVADNNAKAEAKGEDGLIDPEKYESALEQAYFDWESRQAKIDNLTKDLEVTTLTKEQRDTTSQRLFEVAKPELDATVLAITGELDTLYQQLQSGQPFMISGDLAASLGVPEGEVTPENFPLYLKRYRASLKLQMRGRVLAESGLDSNQLTPASDEYFNSILAPIDAIILAADSSFKDAGATLNTIKQGEALNGYQALPSSIRKTLTLINTLPPELRLEVFTSLKVTGIDTQILDMFSVIAANGDPTELKAFTKWVNGDQAQTTVDIASTVLNKGTSDPTLFANTYKLHSTIVKDRPETARKGPGQEAPENRYLSGAAFEKITTKSAEAVNGALAADPEFAAMWSQDISNDLGVTLQAAKNSMQATPWATIRVSSKGVVEAVLNQDAMVELRPGAKRDEEGLKATALGTDAVKLLQKKLQILKGFGKTGTDLVESVSLQTRQEPAKPAPGQNVAPSEEVSNGPIAQRYGLDFARLESERGLPGGYLERVAMIESKGKANAENPKSSAGGLFQQIDSNAREYGVTDRFDPNQSAGGAADFAEDNAVRLRRVLGREPTGGELYLAHQQGGGGAASLLRNPNALAKDVLSEEKVRLNLPASMRSRAKTITAGDFANLWINKYNNVRQSDLPPQAEGRRSSPEPTAPVSTPSAGPAPALTTDVASFPSGQQLANDSSRVNVPPEFDEGRPLRSTEEGNAVAESGVPRTSPQQEVIQKQRDQTLRLLQKLGVEVGSVPAFRTVADAQKAIDDGILKEGDLYEVDGEIEVVEKP